MNTFITSYDCVRLQALFCTGLAVFVITLAATLIPGQAVAQNVSMTIGSAPDSAFEEVTRDEAERAGADRLDEALEDIPGVVLTRRSGLGTTATVDGLPASQVVILVDGVPVGRALNSRAGPATDLASVPVDPASIRRIDVHRGGGPAGSGDAGGVVINIITRASDNLRVRLGARTGVAADQGSTELGLDGTVEGPVGDSLHMGIGGSFSNEASVDVNDDGTPDRPAQSLSVGRAHMRWQRAPGESLTLRASYAHTATRRHALTDDARDRLSAESPVLLNGLFDDRTRLGVLDLRLAGDWRPDRDWRVQHTTALTQQRYVFDKERVRDSVQIPNSETVDLGVRQTVLATVWTGDHTLQPELVLRGGRATREGEPVGNSEDDAPSDDGAFARGFASVGLGLADVWQLSNRVAADARVFGEHHSEFGLGGVASLALSYELSDVFATFVSGSVTRRTPTPEERYFRFDHTEVGYIVDGNPDLEPERLLGVRAGIRGQAGVWSYSLEGYRQSLANAVTVTPLSTDTLGATTFEYANTDRVDSAGVNASSRLDGLPGGLSLRASYAWLPYSHVAETDARLAFSAVHDGAVSVLGEWADDRFSAWARARVRGAMTVPIGSPSADAVTTLDAGVAWDFDMGLRAQVDVENLTGTSDPNWGPFTRQAVFFSLSYQFESSASEPL